jgi:hypothetical protein
MVNKLRENDKNMSEDSFYRLLISKINEIIEQINILNIDKMNRETEQIKVNKK